MRNLYDIEKTLLAQVLMRPGIIDELGIQPEFFSNIDFQTIFTTIEAVRAKQLHVDLVSMGSELSRRDRSDLVAGLASLDAVSAANAAFYAEQLRERLQRTGLIGALRAGLESMKDENKSPVELWDTIAASGTSAMNLAAEPDVPTVQKLFAGYLIQLERRVRQNRDGHSDRITCGIPELDALLGPIRGGELMVVAARPGCGKTSLVLEISRHVAVDLRKSVAFFSLEMRQDEVLDRLMAYEGTAPVGQIRGGYLSDNQLRDTMCNAERLSDAPLSVYDGPTNMTLLRSRIRREKAVRGLSLVVIDYLGLLDMGPGSKASPRWERVGETTRELKLLAIELNITILIAVQLNREADGVEPTLGNLRDSGPLNKMRTASFFFILPKERKTATGTVKSWQSSRKIGTGL